MITVRTGSAPTVRDITAQAAEFVADLGDGLLNIFVPHATAGVAIIETGAGSDDDLSICLVDPNGDNPTRQVRFSFLAD